METAKTAAISTLVTLVVIVLVKKFAPVGVKALL